MTNLLRYDVENRRASVACPDPLCTHQKIDHGDISYDPNECLAVDVSLFTCAGDRAYLIKEIYDETIPAYLCRLYVYDPAKNSITLIHESDNSIYYAVEHYGTVYYSADTYENNENGDPEFRKIGVYAYSLGTGEVVTLSYGELDELVYAYDLESDGIVWRTMGGLYFKTDYGFDSRREVIYPSELLRVNGETNINGYEYTRTETYHRDGALLLYSRYRRNIETGEEEIFLRTLLHHVLRRIMTV